MLGFGLRFVRVERKIGAEGEYQIAKQLFCRAAEKILFL
jgi:hypothetical protein